MKNILLIGTGRFGRHIAIQLSQLGHQVMAVLKEIASYLKITPIHMSRIRHKQSFDSKE